MHIDITTLEQTQALATRLTDQLQVGDVVALYGDLGTGKTTFVQHVLASMGCTEDVTSPTYTLVNVYNTPKGEVWHADCYRLENMLEVENVGLLDYLDDCISLIEWPAIIAPLLPNDRLELYFSLDGKSRFVKVRGTGRWTTSTLQHLYA